MLPLLKKGFLLCCLFFMSIFVFAQDSSKVKIPKFVVKGNSFGVVAGQFQFAFENAITPKSSVQLSLGYIYKNFPFSSSSTYGTKSFNRKTTGFIIIPEYRMYLTAKSLTSPKGLYFAPFLRLRMEAQDLDDTSTDTLYYNKNVSYLDMTTTFGGGILLGFNIIISNLINIDMFIGPQYKSKSTIRNYDYPQVTDADYSNKFTEVKPMEKAGFGVRSGIIFGIVF